MRWEKLGRIFDPRDNRRRWWLHEFAQAPAALLFDDFLRVYFSTRPPPINGQYVSYTGFADFSRKDPTKMFRLGHDPILKLGGLGCFDEFGTYPVSVIRDGDNTRCYYAGWNRGSARFDTAIGVAIGDSKGESFDRIGSGGPVLAASLLEPFILSGPKIRKFGDKWILFYIAGCEWRMMNGRPEPIYKIHRAVSDDGLSWRKHGSNLIQGPKSEVQSGPDVHFADGVYHMYFCYRKIGHHPGKEGGLRIGYAWSNNLVDWHRNDAKAGIDLSEEGWDSEHIRYPHVFEMDGQWWMLYNGNEFGRWGFGLARRTA